MSPMYRRAQGVSLRDFALVLGSSFGLSTACLCPPCAAPGAAAAPATAANPGAQAAPATAAAPSAAVAAGAHQVIWDGEEAATGKSWANCDKAGQCKATLEVAPGEGAKGSAALKLHAEGSGWQGGGWNWHGWYPENAGTDLTGYDDLTLSMKVKGASKETTPSAGGISLAFGCSKDKKTSEAASVGKYVAAAADGQWHDVVIPLKDFFTGKGAECDAQTAWELRVSSWSGTPVNFDVWLDDVAVRKK